MGNLSSLDDSGIIAFNEQSESEAEQDDEVANVQFDTFIIDDEHRENFQKELSEDRYREQSDEEVLSQAFDDYVKQHQIDHEDEHKEGSNDSKNKVGKYILVD